jgi:hypothetical protein
MSAATRTVAVFVIAAAVTAFGTILEVRADLVSHRAIYAMSLGSPSSMSDVQDLAGHMTFEIADVCDGWTLEQRIALEIVNPGGTETRSFTSFTSWESKDGTRFRFEQETKQNGQTVEQLSGRATLEVGHGGIAVLTKPEEMKINLPPGTLFPSKHTEELIKVARAGEIHFVRVVFDGSTVENPNRVSAFIGKPSEMAAAGGNAGKQTVWPVRLAFFPLARHTPEPDVEIGLMLQADGIAREVWLDYGSFTIHGELQAIELISPVAC